MKPFSQAAFSIGTYRVQNNTKMGSDPFGTSHAGFQKYLNTVTIKDTVPYVRLNSNLFQDNLFTVSVAKQKPKDSEK